MKKLLPILLLTIAFSLFGCGASESSLDITEPASDTEKSQNIKTEGDTASFDMQETDIPPSLPPLSVEEKAVTYEGTIPVNYIAATIDSIYISSKDSTEGSCLLEMEIGENTAREIPISPPEGMVFTTITTDESGFLYAAVKNKDNSSHMEIWKIDKTDTVISKFDISEAIENNSWSPWAIAVAGNGDIYLRIGGTDGILAIVFDKDGHFLNKILAGEKENYQLIDAIGRGRDGNIYAVLQEQSGRQIIALMDGPNGCVSTTFENILPEDGVLYAYIGAGRNTDFIIYGAGYGIYGYNLGDTSVKWEIPMEELPFESDQIQRVTSLADGRLLFLSPTLNAENGTITSVAEGTIFYYIPIEKQ